MGVFNIPTIGGVALGVTTGLLIKKGRGVTIGLAIVGGVVGWAIWATLVSKAIKEDEKRKQQQLKNLNPAQADVIAKQIQKLEQSKFLLEKREAEKGKMLLAQAGYKYSNGTATK